MSDDIYKQVADKLRGVSNPHSPRGQDSLFGDEMYHGYYSDRYSSTGASPGKPTAQNYKPSAVAYVEVQDAQGNVMGTWYVEQYEKEWALEAAKYFNFEQRAADQGIPTLIVPDSHVKMTEGTVPFNPCVYTATKDYLQAFYGTSLHTTDQDWLARHPLATDGGVPLEYMPTCIHELVAPYGFVVSRIRLKAGMVIVPDSFKPWIKALGMSPFAQYDHTTSNADTEAKLGLPAGQADQLFRVDFGPAPLPGSIIAETGWASTAGVAVGNQGGHSRYLAPRGTASSTWCISIQLARSATYDAPVETTAYVPRRGKLTLSLHDVFVDATKSRQVAKKHNGRWQATDGSVPTTVVVSKPVTATIVPSTPTPGASISKPSVAYNYSKEGVDCVICKGKKQHWMFDPQVHGVLCAECDIELSSFATPDSTGVPTNGTADEKKTTPSLVAGAPTSA